jgi:dihydrofolate reductase
MTDLPVLLIAGINNLGCIGNDEGDLLIKCQRDLQRFKELSMNGVLILGRKTYESLPRALENRSYVVISENTRKNNLKHPKSVASEDVVRVRSIDSALNAAFELAEARGRDCIVIAGGSAIFDHFMYDADRLHITRFDNDDVSLTRFPLEKFEVMLSEKRIIKTRDYEFYDGEMKVTFTDYALSPCVEAAIGGDFVKLRNGVRFRLSSVTTYMLTDDCVVIAQDGFAFKVHPEDMNLSQLLSELDELIGQYTGADTLGAEMNIARVA